MTAHWSEETLDDAERWTDTGLVRAGLRLFEELPRSAPTQVLLATELHGPAFPETRLFESSHHG